MYIAVIADNIADRKQLERLLSRANDAISDETGTLYIDSFGDEKSFLSTAMRYEIFFVDIVSGEDQARNVIEILKNAGVPGRIVVCRPEGTPFSYADTIDGLLSIDKPILTAPLHQLLKNVHADYLKEVNAVKKVETRSKTDTHYIPVNEILYAIEEEHMVNVHLENGDIISMLGDLSGFARSVSTSSEFIEARNDIIVNSNHIISRTKKEIVLTNKETLRLKRFSFF